jgi:RNA polymerase sigma factor (sigma-70 family)
MLTVIRNTIVDHWRRTKARERLNGTWTKVEGRVTHVGLEEADVLDPETDPETIVIRREESRKLLAILNQLSAIERHIILGFYFHEKSLPELAQDLGKPVGTVKWHISKARGKLGKLVRQARETND